MANFKKIYESISKARPTRQTINPMALKLFPHTICGVIEH